MHITELRTLHQTRNYEKIHDQIQQEMRKLAMGAGTSAKDLDELKLFVEEEAQRNMHRLQGISKPLVSIMVLLGGEFEAKMRDTVVPCLVARHSADYQEFLNNRFQRLSSLRECFVWMEEVLAKCSLKHLNIPVDWNLSSEILMKLYILTKQKVCDYFFYCDIEETDFVEALDTTLKYERRLGKTLRRGRCCVPMREEVSLVAEGCSHPGEVVDTNIISQEHCSHTMMLSSLFLPNIKIYLKAFFDCFLKSEPRQYEAETHIISEFLNFFHSVGKVLKKLEYFNDRQAYECLIQHFDGYLSVLVRNIRLETGLYESAVVLNTLLFIRETSADFLDQIHERTDIEGCTPKTCTEVRRIEKFHNISIDECLCECFKCIDFSRTNDLSRSIVRFLDERIMAERFRGISEDIRVSLLEGVVSNIFSRICSIRMTPETSEILLLEMSEVKKYLKTKTKVVPLMDVIEKYLKIFLCPVESGGCFIENFDLVSEGMFSFEQIVRNVCCGDKAEELCSAYDRRLEGLIQQDTGQDIQ